MDQQHQNYESFNDFGFVNAFAAGSENYAMNPPPPHESDLNSKGMSELSLPALMSQGYDSRTIENTSLYDLSNPQYSQVQYHHPMASSNASAIEQQPKLPIADYSMQSDLINTSVPQSTPSRESLLSPERSTTKGTAEQLPEPGTSKSSLDTVSFDPSQNSMLKALGVVRKDVLGANSNKKRKRIVLLNDDDSDDASDLKNEVYSKSSELDESTKKDEDNVACEADNESDQDDSENLTDIGALKAKFLLKNAVIIQGPDKKKKKKSRLLDSDDEEQIHATSIDDIGMVNENENEEESFENDILITEPIMPVELVEESCKSRENCNQPAVYEKSSQESAESMPQTTTEPLPIEEALQSSEIEQKDESIKTSEENSKNQSMEDNDIDPSMSVEAILENIKPMADDDEFFKFEKSSDENDKQIPNDEYFGSADKQEQG